MTIRDLIDTLQELADVHGDELEVRLAHQPHWALEYTIGRIEVADPDDDDDDDDDIEELEARANADEPAPDEEQPPVVYIGEGQQVGYLSEHASRALGWSRR